MSIRNQAKAAAVAKKLGIPIEDFQYLGDNKVGIWGICFAITPAIAAEWLKLNTNNRKEKKRSIDVYAEDMTNDNWQFTHQGIAFGLEAELKDGQNRLKSIVKSGVASVKSLVFIGLSDEAKAVVDNNVGRTDMDAAKFAGLTVTKLQMSSNKICEVGLKGNTRCISSTKSLQLLEKHKEAFDFVKTNLLCDKPQRGVEVSSICAPIMRCFYAIKSNPQKLARLKKFCQILQDGQYNRVNEDNAPYRLRELTADQNFDGSTSAKELYRLSEAAIQAFLDGTALQKKFKPAKQELWPFESELEAERLAAENAAKAAEEKVAAKAAAKEAKRAAKTPTATKVA